MDTDSLTSTQRWRSLVVVFASATIAGLTFGLTIPLLSLILERDGVGTDLIGLNSAATPLAMLVIGPLMPRFIGWLGALRAMYAGIALSAVTILLLPVFPGLTAWFVLRFFLGVGSALHWVVSETWINTIAREEHRGRVMGAYTTMLALGFAGGPLLITFIGVEGWLPFLVGAGVITAAAIPLLFARGLAPPIPARPEMGLWRVLRHAPVIMAAMLICGFGDMAILTLLPLYGLHSGLDQDLSVLMLSVAILGSLVLQLPLGWLADRMDRRRLLLGCAWIGILGPAALPFVVHHDVLLWPLLFLWGGTLAGLYTLGLTLLGERFSPAALAGASTVFIMVYEAGSIAGPVISGAAMKVWDPHGLPAVMALVCAVYVLVVYLHRRARRHRVVPAGGDDHLV